MSQRRSGRNDAVVARLPPHETAALSAVAVTESSQPYFRHTRNLYTASIERAGHTQSANALATALHTNYTAAALRPQTEEADSNPNQPGGSRVAVAESQRKLRGGSRVAEAQLAELVVDGEGGARLVSLDEGAESVKPSPMKVCFSSRARPGECVRATAILVTTSRQREAALPVSCSGVLTLKRLVGRRARRVDQGLELTGRVSRETPVRKIGPRGALRSRVREG